MGEGQNLTAAQVIEKRKELWTEKRSIGIDSEFIQSVAGYLASADAEQIRKEIQERPELLVEMAFVIVNKDKETVPFLFNAVQRSFMADLNTAIEDMKAGRRQSLKFLILKGRQQGFTSLITAYQLACCITKRNFSGFTLADDADNTETIFEDKCKFPFSQLPPQLRPTVKYNSRREMQFEHLNSRWRVATAGGKSVGRSRTLNFFHGSETSFYTDLELVMASLEPALTKDSIQILESTANGYNLFKSMWDDNNNWENKFYAWWLTPEYSLKFVDNSELNEFWRNVGKGAEWIYKRCRWLVEEQGLKVGQAYWYYKKWIDLREMIKQEYPCTADEAFLSTGTGVFDRDIIIARKEYLKKLYADAPPKRGSFAFEWRNPETKDKIKDDTIIFVENPNGFIWIYEDTEKNYPYCIGGDTKGEGSDKFAATVINNVTGKRVAVLHGDMDPDTYTHQVYCLGKYYNLALIGIEINFDIYPVKELDRLRYPRQYTRIAFDDKTRKEMRKYGWKTDGNTRPMIISNETVVLRDNIELFTHIPMLDECLTFVYDTAGRPDAESGKHDDLLFSDMIANQIRTSQAMRVSATGLPRKAPRTKLSEHTAY